jgi:hypothetical protein
MFPSHEFSDILYPYVVPAACTLMLALWIGAPLVRIRRLERENARLRRKIVEHKGVDIFAD